jgi:hypothetical protein
MVLAQTAYYVRMSLNGISTVSDTQRDFALDVKWLAVTCGQQGPGLTTSDGSCLVALVQEDEILRHDWRKEKSNKVRGSTQSSI